MISITKLYQMEPVILKPMYHREQECIGIYFEKNEVIQSLIQKQAGAKWSRTKSCWYIPLLKNKYEQLATVLKGKVELRNDELKKYLLGKKDDPVPGIAEKFLPVSGSKKNPEKSNGQLQQVKPVHLISKENNGALQKFKQQLVLKSYSPSTIKTYTNEFVQFLHTIKNNRVEAFSVSRIKDYLQYCFNELHLSEATLHSRINALKFSVSC